MKSLTTNGNKSEPESKQKHHPKPASSANGQTKINLNDSIFSNNSDDAISSPVHRPHTESTKPKQYRKFMEHAGKLQQLNEMDANLQQHFAKGGILNLATLSTEAGADDSSNAETAIIESSCVELSQKRLKNIIGNVDDIQLKPPLISIISQEVVPPSWDPQTLGSLPSPPLHLDLATIKDQQKIDLIHEAVYGREILRSMRVKNFVERCLLLSKEKPFFSFDMLFRVIYHLANDKQWLISLAKVCNIKRESPQITNLGPSPIPVSGVNLESLWHIISLQLDSSPSCYSPGERSFLLSLSLLLSVDNNLDLCNVNLCGYASSLFEAADLSMLRVVRRAVLKRVTHHHTLLRLCSSVNDWNSNASAFQVWIALHAIFQPHKDENKDQEEHISKLDDIYGLVPNRVLEFFEFALSDRNMDQHCDFYKLHSELHSLYLVLKFSQVPWSLEQFQSLKSSLQLLSKMFRKYSLNLDGIKIKECIRHLINRVDMEC